MFMNDNGDRSKWKWMSMLSQYWYNLHYKYSCWKLVVSIPLLKELFEYHLRLKRCTFVQVLVCIFMFKHVFVCVGWDQNDKEKQEIKDFLWHYILQEQVKNFDFKLYQILLSWYFHYCLLIFHLVGYNDDSILLG